MFIDSILAKKGNSVVTINVKHTLGDVVRLLVDHNIGACVVLLDDTVVGIVSERDIVRHLSKTSENPLTLPIEKLMTPNPKTCSPQDSVDQAINIMSRGRFRHLPVIENNALVGIISMGDLVQRRIELAEQEAEFLKDYIAG